MNIFSKGARPDGRVFASDRAGPLGIAMLAVSLLSACGGDGSEALQATPTGTASSAVVPPTPPTPVAVSCVDGPSYQCSGASILRIDNGVAMTDAGVQAYGKSTSDLADPIAVRSGASGFALALGGVAEIRLARDANGAPSAPALLLSNIGLSWDGVRERPQIVETFQTTQGRTQLDAKGALSSIPLPDSADLGFYDFATKGAAGTQTNYANNRYFPRSGNPSRCPPDATVCPTAETDGPRYQAGDWRSGGSVPDVIGASRLHSDGDVHAGNGKPGANGQATTLPGGSGPGIAFPGSKGYRSLTGWSFQYANLAAWVTQDTVLIEEWAARSNEHNKNRRGVVAFGAVSDPVAVPTSGGATYSGIVYGWYAGNATTGPAVFRGTVSVSANFATREVVATFRNTLTDDAAAASVPVALRAVTATGAVPNYLTGAADNGGLKGGLGGRFFGPVVATGTSGAGPAEIGGALSMLNPATGEAVVGGFIARKQ